MDGGIQGDEGVRPVAVPGSGDVEWNRYRFALDAPAQFVDLSFFTAKDEEDVGHVFAVRIDGRLVYSGRAGIDHDASVLVDKKGIRFLIKAGFHQLQVHTRVVGRLVGSRHSVRTSRPSTPAAPRGSRATSSLACVRS